MAYLITFTCYGHRLHGHEEGSVDRDHNLPGTPRLSANPARIRSEQKRARQEAYTLDNKRRNLVLESVREACSYRGWRLLAAHVRSSHVHTVVVAAELPERVLQDFKTYSSRSLNQAAMDGAGRNRWARHGSTRYLWNPEQIGAAIHYVVREQGDQMAVWEDKQALP